ncbi:MAG: thiamine pyrophosphate-binding protein [Gammaproteobacteria bacterium]|nr:thiamine pyrophosphate-binding protein [Gammaproteobacteria bacterium]
MNLCEVVVRLCRDVNISIFFGVPGIHNLPIYAALNKLETKLYTTRHEQSAAFMADGYARATGKVAGCVLIDGPGFLNAATAIGQANADSIPMVVLTPCFDSKRTGVLHQLPGQGRISRELCRTHIRLTEEVSPETIGFQLQNHLSHKRPGVLHIEIPMTLFDRQTDFSFEFREDQVVPEQNDGIVQAKNFLQQANTTLIIAGGGSLSAVREIQQLAETIDAPVVNTTASKGILPLDHPLRVGASPSLPEVRQFIELADAVVAVGTELGETDFDFFLTGKELDIKQLIRIDIDPSQLHANVRADLPIRGLAKDVISGLYLTKEAVNSGAERVGALSTLIQKNRFYDTRMRDFLSVIQDRTDVLVGDSAQPNYFALWLYEPRFPRSYFHSVTGFGTLGYGIPAAIGAKIGRLNDRVACLIGDGGAGYTLAEVQTATQFELNIPFIIWNNYGFKEIDKAVSVESSSRYYDSPRPPCYRALTDAFGMEYSFPQNLGELDSALEMAFSRSCPTIIEVEESRFVDSVSLENWFKEPLS